jgi:malonyl-CoA O-methyltransferase
MATPLTAREAYERWAETYPAEAHNPLMQAEETIVSRILAQLTAKRALDVGTGSGRYLPLLAAIGAASVVGIDRSMAMLRRGSASSRVCADACRLPFGRAAFDVINASLMVGDLDDVSAFVREMTRVLSPGGHLVYSDFHPTWHERGWQRTFRSADGALNVVEYQPHAIDDHLAAIDAANLRLIAIREPRLRIKRADVPVVAIFHAVKERVGS